MPALRTRLRIGLIGLSDIARRRFLPAVARTAASLTMVGRRQSDGNEGLAAAIAVRTYEEVLASPEVDLVYISLPNDLHEEWSCRAFAAGKHVLCEKPLAPSLAGVERMLAAADESGRLLYENLMFLHHPQHAVVKQAVEQGAVGCVRSVQSVFGFALAPDPNNFRWAAQRGGGVCADLLVYPVATAELFDLELHEAAGLLVCRDGLDVSAHGVAHVGRGRSFTFRISFDQDYQSYYEVIGDAGRLRLERAYTTPCDFANTLRLHSARGEETRLLPAADHFAETIRHVDGLLQQGTDFTAVHAHLRRRHRILARLQSALHPVSDLTRVA